MATKEGEVLAALYKSIAEALTANPDMDLFSMRAIMEMQGKVASEPTGVLYEEAQPAGMPGLWAKPLNTPSDDRAIVFFHGGGFMTCSIDSHRKLAGHLANAAATNVLMVEYRRTPEHQFPAQLHDGVAAIKWLFDQGFRPGRVAAAGDSAGGNLAIASCLKLRNEGMPLPAAIVGFSPWLDMEVTPESTDTSEAPDARMKKRLVGDMVAAFLGDQPRDNPLANPLHADLAGLPPMFLNCGSWEGLKGDALRIAERAKKAGVEVHLEVTQGMQHVHVLMAGRAPEADDVLKATGKWVQSKFDKVTQPS